MKKLVKSLLKSIGIAVLGLAAVSTIFGLIFVMENYLSLVESGIVMFSLLVGVIWLVDNTVISDF